MSESFSDLSECSNSPISYNGSGSPYSSPLQQVPQPRTILMGLSCIDKNLYKDGNKAFLRIIEQPQEHFRFRYDTEKTGVSGTHGGLHGKSSISNKNKTHPTVELVNFSGEAFIKCHLKYPKNANSQSSLANLYKVLEQKQNRSYCYKVPENGSYAVGFRGIGIDKFKKEDICNQLYMMFSEQLELNNRSYNAIELQEHCKKLTKAMKLNIVHLKFSAHDVHDGKEICDPVFSDPIHDKKCVTTNELNICRMSMWSGRPRGGEDAYMFVEKVDRKNIKICFFEEDENRKRIWSAMASFLPSDVHYQYAIAFRTPPYQNPKTAVDVKVFIELVRPSDGKTSEPIPFTYKADEVDRLMRRYTNTSLVYRRRKCGHFSSTEVSSYVGELTNDTSTSDNREIQPATNESEWGFTSDLGSVLSLEPAVGMLVPHAAPSIMWPAPSATLPVLPLASTDPTNHDIGMDISECTLDDVERDYMELFNLTSSDGVLRFEMDSGPNTYVSDSGRSTGVSTSHASGSSVSNSNTERTSGNPVYWATYKANDAAEVKKLVKDICDMIRKKSSSEEVKSNLQRMLDIRLSNGDTSQKSFEAIVKVIHAVKMTHLLNYANDKQETVLHLAVVSAPPSVVSLLVAKGCDPMLKNAEEENALHLAVRYNPASLPPLLDGAACELDASNRERQSALHLCALHGAAASAALLAARGASCGARDAAGRTPLHLCAYDARPHVARALLPHVPPSEVDAVDGGGHTALQVACARALSDDSLELVELLLAARADPLRREPRADSAWRLAQGKPELRAALRRRLPPGAPDDGDDLKSEPDDDGDYESADDGSEDDTLDTLATKLGGLGLVDTAITTSKKIE